MTEDQWKGIDEAVAAQAPPLVVETSKVEGDVWEVTLPRTNIHTLDQLLDYFKVDLMIWEVDRFICNKWEVAMKPSAAGEPATHEQLFQVKAFLKRKRNVQDAKAEIEALVASAKAQIDQPPRLYGLVNHLSTGFMLELNITDHHFGKLAWHLETGHGNYDLKIAVDKFNKAFETLLYRTKGFAFDEIWFVVGNDMLNNDDAEYRTTRGTVVTSDQRYQKVFATVRETMTKCIEKLRRLAPKVQVIMVAGNHDKLSVWHLGHSLECYFHQHQDVVIHNDPTYYKYFQFGKVMLMFTHGDKGKRNNFPLMMAAERPEMFGATKFREVHTGHYHKVQAEESYGVRVRILPALCEADDWHAENGYVGNLRSSEAFVWHQDEGLINITIYTDLVESQ